MSTAVTTTEEDVLTEHDRQLIADGESVDSDRIEVAQMFLRWQELTADERRKFGKTMKKRTFISAEIRQAAEVISACSKVDDLESQLAAKQAQLAEDATKANERGKEIERLLFELGRERDMLSLPLTNLLADIDRLKEQIGRLRLLRKEHYRLFPGETPRGTPTPCHPRRAFRPGPEIGPNRRRPLLAAAITRAVFCTLARRARRKPTQCTSA
jgi:hypothetical protein